MWNMDGVCKFTLSTLFIYLLYFYFFFNIVLIQNSKTKQYRWCDGANVLSKLEQSANMFRRKKLCFETRKYKKVVVQCSVLVMWMFAESYPQIDREFSTYSPRISNRIRHMFTFQNGGPIWCFNNMVGTYRVWGCTILQLSHQSYETITLAGPQDNIDLKSFL